MKKNGKVYIIGAGPGDWELVSLKGLKRIQEADVILFDFLSTKDLLGFSKKKARVICVGKADGMHIKEQQDINQLLRIYASQGKIVVRLKGGDPLLFSRGIEEALYLRRHKIPFEIIPGITSAFAAVESFGIPLTVKGKFSSVAVLTGRKSNGKTIDAPASDTLIYLMAVANIAKVVETILRSGRGEGTPCAFIERGTTSAERIIRGNLSNIVERAKRYAVRPPAVFIVGEVIRYGEKIYADKYSDK